MSDPRSAPVTVPSVRAAKVRDGHAPLVMVTAYDVVRLRSGLRATASTPAPAGYIRARWFQRQPQHTSIT